MLRRSFGFVDANFYHAAIIRGFSNSVERVTDETDVLVIGGGPSGLSTAIRLKQLVSQKSQHCRVVLLEKGSDIGSHILSGAVFEPRSLDELLPNWKELEAPIHTAVTTNQLKYLTKSMAIPLPPPPVMSNTGNYIISLSDLCKWLAKQAESLGVEIYSGIAGSQLWLSQDQKSLQGVITNDVGISKSGQKKSSFQPGMAIKAKVTVLAEGSHGSLTKQTIQHFRLRDPSKFQVYALGVKELWEIDPNKHVLGTVVHTLGYPLPGDVYGGGFVYHAENNLVYIGLIAGLNYENPYFSPYHELQRYKLHPYVRNLLNGGKCIQYGARTLAQGGVQSLPKLYFPGGLIVGCSAGFLNTAKIKGNHTAIKSGMLAAETIFDALSSSIGKESVSPLVIPDYEARLKDSWLYKELWHVRNEKPGFQYGRTIGILNAAFESITFGRAPWTLQHKMPDHVCTKPIAKSKPIVYPKPDGVLTFSLLDNLSRSGTNHEEDQPCHLTLKDASIPSLVNLPVYGGPESYYCPAGVYEYVDTVTRDTQGTKNSEKRLQINAQNCVHCKTCDIKDPTQNINWIPPEGGGGPQYNGT